MNHLAHLFLSCSNDDLLIGNFIADYIKNKEVATYIPAIQEGIYLHRKIDTFTDNHPLVLQGTHRLQANHHKYSPVVIDILYDYILSKNWHRYSPIPLQDFAKNVYQILTKRYDELPQKLQQYLHNMIADNWLLKYGTYDGLAFVFEKMDQRTKFPSNFTAAVQDLKDDYELYETEFNQFFPEVMKMVEEECGC